MPDGCLHAMDATTRKENQRKFFIVSSFYYQKSFSVHHPASPDSLRSSVSAPLLSRRGVLINLSTLSLVPFPIPLMPCLRQASSCLFSCPSCLSYLIPRPLCLSPLLPRQLFITLGSIVHKCSNNGCNLFQVVGRQVVIYIHIAVVGAGIIFHRVLNELETW